MIEELKEKIITLEQKLNSHELDDFRQHRRIIEQINEKADKDDVRELKSDIEHQFKKVSDKFKEANAEIYIIAKEMSRYKTIIGVLIAVFGGIGYLITWAVDRWDKIKGYLS